MLADVQHLKSEASRTTMLIIIRALEAIIHDQPRTPFHPKHHGPDDGLGLGSR